MTSRRNHGEGGLYWNERRQRWIATVDRGFTVDGKRRRLYVSGRTKTEAKAKLQQARRDRDDGLPAELRTYTVREAIEDWLEFGLTNKAPSTRTKERLLAERHILPALGPRRLTDLTARDIDRFLTSKTAILSTDTLKRLHSALRRAIARAQTHDLVRRNVGSLATTPTGTGGRASKSLNFAQAEAILTVPSGTPLFAYVVTSLLTGVRTEELRALDWDHVHLDDDPPSIEVWRSVRQGGDTKTAKSRRTLELPERCVTALRAHRDAQAQVRRDAGSQWADANLVFCTSVGTALDAANVRRSFRHFLTVAGLDPGAWTPRELRHSFVSLLSSSGMPIEQIAHLVGHTSTRVTEKVYRKELRPVLTRGARAMDEIFRSVQDPLAVTLAVSPPLDAADDPDP